jgi:Flp pilus assembly protein TadG
MHTALAPPRRWLCQRTSCDADCERYGAMLLNPARYLRRGVNMIARFGRASRGSAAIDFALIAPPLLAISVAIFETAIFLFAQQTLQNAAETAGRIFLTGQGQSSGMTQTQFTNAVCPMVQPLFNCSSLMIDVQSYATFASTNTSDPTLTFNGQGQVTNSWSYNPGGCVTDVAPNIIVVRLIYQWPVIGALLGFTLSNLANGSSQMMGISVFRVEPYCTASSG